MTSSPTARRPAEVLLVEDNQGDVLLTREGFKRSSFPVNLHHVENGEDCLAFLKKEGAFAGVPTPDLILLDLNMPVMDGREVMKILVADPRFCHVPVVVLTTSANEQDVWEMYSLRCSTYIVKPLDFEEFQHIIQVIAEYWFSVATLPGARP
ncbi:MAG: response regulator receiver protein [Rhodocyclaceae bacterium]|nr:response regulator receiver protein [Rhodocyclaceae bacterium]